MEATAERLYFFSSEFDAREEAIRRKQYYSDMDRLKKELAERDEVIAENEKALAENEKALAENEKALAENEKALAESVKELAEKDKTLALQNAEIEELKEMIRSLKGGSKE